MVSNILLVFILILVILWIILEFISRNLEKGNNLFDEDNVVDDDFKEKVSKITSLIIHNKKSDIREIAKLSKCNTIEECLIKIKYIEYHNLVPNLHIDTNSLKIIHCTLEDEKLLNVYMPYIYYTKMPIADMFLLLDGKYTKEKIYNDLSYLCEKGLIYWAHIDAQKKEIIYHKKEMKKHIKKDLVSVTCPTCGALNEVNHGTKSKCSYCQNDIVAL